MSKSRQTGDGSRRRSKANERASAEQGRQTRQAPQTRQTVKANRSVRARGKLKPMRVSMGFREFVLDQLGGIADLRAKPMFGGIGLYAGDVFFGMMAADLLYFKVDATTEREYVAAGSTQFAPYADPNGMKMPYYTVPAGVLESAPTVVDWASRSIAVAKALAKAKAKPKAKTAAGQTKTGRS